MRTTEAVVALISLVVALCGCSNPLVKYQSALAASTLVEARQLTSAILLPNVTRKDRLDANGPAIAWGTDRSFAKLYRLDKSSQGMSIHVVGDCDCGHAETAVWMLPNVSFLDPSYRVLQTSDAFEIFNRVKSEYWSERIVAVASVEIPKSDAAYVMIHTSKKSLARGVGMSYARAQTTAVGGTSINAGANNYSYVIPASPVGPFEITLIPKGQATPTGATFESPPFGVIVDNPEPR
jgi:hypothetical protein